MLANIKYWEEFAQKNGFAIPHFNVWNAEMLMGVIDAAEETKAPIIISFGTGFIGNTIFEEFAPMMVSMAKMPLFPLSLIGIMDEVWRLFKMPIIMV